MAATAASFYDQALDRDDLAALLASDEVTLNEIVEGLYHGQAVVRRNAAIGASLVADLPDPGRALLRMSAKDSDEDVRRAIVTAMAQGDYPVDLAMGILFDGLLDSVEEIAETALEGIELRLTRAKDEVLPHLAAGLRAAHPLVSKACAATLVKSADASVDTLVPLLGDGDPGVRRSAYDVLEDIRWSAIPQLVRALHDAIARPLAARLLGAVGELPAPSVETLEKLAADPDPALAEAAGRVLLESRRPRAAPPRTAPLDVPIDGFLAGPLDAAALDAAAGVDVPLSELFYALRDGRDHVRQNAVALIGRRADAKDEAVDALGALTPLAKDGSRGVRRAACEALGAVAGPRAARPLVRALGDPLAEVGQAARDALANLGVDGVSPMLAALSRDLPEVVHDAVVELMTRAGAAATAALADALSESPSSAARVASARALGGIGKAAEDGIAALLRGLADPASAEVRQASARALGFVGVVDPTILTALRQALNDEAPAVRRAAAIAASRISGRPLDDRGARESAPIPIDGFETELLTADALAAARGELPLAAFVAKLTDGRDVVRANAATAIGTFGTEGGEAAEPLAALLRDGAVTVRRAVLEAFRALGPAAEPAAYWLLVAPADADPECSELGVEVLAGLHATIDEFLIEALRVDATVAEATIHRVFARLEAKGVPILVAALKNGSALIRRNAARALEIIAKKGGDSALDALEARLADPVGDVRSAASDAIDAIKGGIPKPPKVLEPEPVDIDGFFDTALPAEVLAEQAGKTTVERMVRALRDGRGYVRENAAAVLSGYGEAGAAAVGPLAVALKDGLISVRVAAVAALGTLAASCPGPAPDILIGALSDPAPAVAAAAQEALVGLGERALPALVAGLGRPLEVAARTVLPILARHGEAARKLLGDALADPSPTVRAAAARGLLMLGRDVAEPSRAEVDAALKDADRAVRLEARRVMDHLDRKDEAPKAIESTPIPIPGFEEKALAAEVIGEAKKKTPLADFVAKLRDGRAVVRANAARAIGTFGDAAGAAVEWLGVLLKDDDVDVRRAAMAAITALGEAAVPAGPALVGALSDRDAQVSDGAVAALAALHAQLGDVLVEALRVDPEVGQKTIQRVFVTLEGAGVDLLKAALKNSSGLIRVNAALTVAAIARVGGTGAQTELEDALDDPVKDVRSAAQLAIDEIAGGRPKPVVALEPVPVPIDGFEDGPLSAEALAKALGDVPLDVLVAKLRDGRAVVRRNAALALGARGDEGAQAADWLGILVRDEDVEVRRATLTALHALGENAVSAATAMVLALTDDDDQVRDTAVEALVAIHERIVDALVEGLRVDPEAAERGIRRVFVKLEGKGVDALKAGLASSSGLIRVNAAMTVGAIARKGGTGAQKELEDALEDPIKMVRVAAKDALDEIAGGRPKPIVALEPQPLPHEQFETTLLTPELLAEVKAAIEPARMFHALYDGRWLVRANAAQALAVLDDKQLDGAGAHLVLALKDDKADVRRRAALAFAAVGADRAQCFDLVIALDDPSPHVVEAVEEALVAAKDAAIPAYLYALDNLPSLAARSVLPMLARLEKKAVDPLVAALAHDVSLVRQNALIGLRLLAPKVAAGARAAVSTLRFDPVRDVRLESFRTLDYIDEVPARVLVREPMALPVDGFDVGPMDVETLKKAKKSLDAAALEALLLDGRRVVRENAARALGVLGAAPPALAMLLKDGVPEVRLAAGEAIASAGDAGADSARALVGALADRDMGVRRVARDVLVALAGAKAKKVAAAAHEALLEGLRVSPDVAIRTVIPVLVEAGASSVGPLVAVLDHVSPFVRLNALGALVKLAKDGVDAHRDAVEATLVDPLDAIRRTAQLVLDRVDGKGPGAVALDAVPIPAGFDTESLDDKALKKVAKDLDGAWVVGALGDGRPFVRENAARTLGLGKAEDGVVAALARGLKDSHGPVRVAAAMSLGALKADPDVAVPALAAALREADEELGGAALEALAAFGDKAVVAELTGAHLAGREEIVVASIGRAAHAMAKAFVPALAKVAADQGRNLVERENAVSILGDLGVGARKAEEALLGLLVDMQGMISVKAIHALAKGAATPGPEVCKTLTEHLMNEPRPSVHYAVRDAVRVLKRKD